MMIAIFKLASAGIASAGLTFAAASLLPPELGYEPDPKLTPGAVASVDLAEICRHDGGSGSAYSRQHRHWTGKADTLRKYGIPLSEGHLYEDDDRVPVCGGGDNMSPANHWPQIWSQARLKDHLEAYACHEVCAGHVPLATAQGWFLGDWREAYRQVFGKGAQ